MKIITLCVFMIGCNINGDGKVVSLNNGDIVHLEMSFSKTGGSMSGYSSSGEFFQGEYQATWDADTYNAYGNPTMNSTATGNGYIIGDRGTNLNCQGIHISPGNMIFRTQPHGTGMCKDQYGRPYRISF